MKQIIPPQKEALQILGNPKNTNMPLRLMKYCLSQSVEDGILLLNLMTRELLLLSREETTAPDTAEMLHQKWFAVAEDFNEKEYAGLLRWAFRTRKRKYPNITRYTILTTTDCNARCFYCYEAGCRRIRMDAATARKTAQHIISACGGEPVHISWFGGEPLYNHPVIDLICQILSDAGVEYTSSMVSNGYLFTDEIISRAISLWHLNQVQITLDGTEEIYNKSKAYIYPEGSAYQVVIANIRRLLEAGIAVAIRLNLGFHNADDLLLLAGELARQFEGFKKLNVYAHLLFDPANTRTPQQLSSLYQALTELENLLCRHGLFRDHRLRRCHQLNHCMADQGNALVIVPDGHIGLCEHYCESEFIGHLDSPDRDQAMIRSWREYQEELPECADCPFFPECLILKKCENHVCNPFTRQETLQKTLRAMVTEYTLWKNQHPHLTNTEETYEEDVPDRGPDC